MRYSDLPLDVQEMIEQAYYDGLVDDKLYAFLIDKRELLVVPDKFPEMEGTYIRDNLGKLDALHDFVQYLNDNDNIITVEDFNEELVKDFDENTYEIIKEHYIQDFMENEYENISKQFFRR